MTVVKSQPYDWSELLAVVGDLAEARALVADLIERRSDAIGDLFGQGATYALIGAQLGGIDKRNVYQFLNLSPQRAQRPRTRSNGPFDWSGLVEIHTQKVSADNLVDALLCRRAAIIRSLVDSGASYPDIGEQMGGLSRQRVYDMAHRQAHARSAVTT